MQCSRSSSVSVICILRQAVYEVGGSGRGARTYSFYAANHIITVILVVFFGFFFGFCFLAKGKRYLRQGAFLPQGGPSKNYRERSKRHFHEI